LHPHLLSALFPYTTLFRSTVSNMGGTLGPTQGGTGLASYAQGDVLYASAANTLAALAQGTAGYFLKMVAGVPAWAALFYQTIRKDRKSTRLNSSHLGISYA